ncbi:hypothetical protein Y032_0331g2733 [Ancylostoma ceylanicum]|uniref:Uncharacterized protein n=1 Tax=Ancylostoma ceylanicum TaxID=53326 RepID=A0A016RZJ5_9BILA|nr:hypothetical protein Y032_0331g2733 [Ancylostoma ceylanicum]
MISGRAFMPSSSSFDEASMTQKRSDSEGPEGYVRNNRRIWAVRPRDGLIITSRSWVPPYADFSSLVDSDLLL